MGNTITFDMIEQEAASSELSLQDFTQAIWNLLYKKPDVSKRLGKALKVAGASNFANVYQAVVYRLVGSVYPELTA